MNKNFESIGQQRCGVGGWFWKGVKLGLLALWVFSVTPASAAPMKGLATTFTQPDGTVLQLRVTGDEFYARTETQDGYTVIFDPAIKTFYYATLSPDGNELVSTGTQAGRGDPQVLGLKKNLEINPASRAAKARKRYEEHEAVVKQQARWDAVKTASRKYQEFKKQVKEQEKAGKKGFAIPLGTVFPDSEIPSAPAMSAPAAGDGTVTEEPPIAPSPPSFTLSGNVVGLTILVDFSDVPGTVVTQSQMDDYCNKPGYTGFSQAGSVYDYFFIQSGGNLRYNNNVTYYVRVPQPKSYYNDTSVDCGVCGRLLLNDALDVLLANGYDFSKLTTKSGGYVRACNVLFAGADSGVWSYGLWPHRYGIPAKHVGGGMYVSDYQITEIGTTPDLLIGTVCHENGHMLLGYPDFYSYDGNAAGVGSFSLMAGGNFGGGGKHPTNIDPYLKAASGWMDVIDLTTNSQQRCTVQVDGNQLYRYRNPAKSTEYFLFEVRDDTGWEGPYGGQSGSVNPTAGLVVYHAYETGNNPYSSIWTAENPNCSYTTPYELLVVEANPQLVRTPWYDQPSLDGNDAFKSSGKSHISDTTIPELKFWVPLVTSSGGGRKTASGCVITNISVDGPSMTFVIGSGMLTNTPNIALSRSTLDSFCDYGGTAPSNTFTICNGQGGTLNYTISTNQSWLSCTPASGTASNETDTITVNFATSGLAVGVHTATITVTDPGASPTNATISVNLTVFAQPIMSLSSTNISVNGLSGMTGPQASFAINNTGGGTMAYSLIKTQSWLTLSSTNGTVAAETDTIYAYFNATSLGFGTYQDTITITSSNATNSPRVISVTLRVLLLTGSDIAITGNSLIIAPSNTTPTVARGTDYGIVSGPVEHTFGILNQSAVTTLGLTNAPKVTVSSPSGYFSLSQDAATNALAPGATTSFKITYNPLAGGLHTGTVSVASTDSALPRYSFAVSGIFPGMPAVTNYGAGPAEQAAATLTGGLTAGGVANLYLCWGATDGGTSSTGAWQHVVALGTNIQNSVFTNRVTGLLFGISYDCRVYATNGSGTAWSTLRNFSAAQPNPRSTAGLISGTIAGTLINTTTPNPGNGDGNAVTNRGPWRAKSKNDWGDNLTFVYTGQMYFDGTPYFFVESIDDDVWLKIDGTVYMNNSTWNDTSSSGLISKPQGWYDFELRLHNGGGGSGYVNLNPGFQYHNGGGTSTADVDNGYPEDTGDATLFRTEYVVPVPLNPITNTIADNITATTADLHGVLNAYQAVYTVTAFWSTNNNANPAAWLADTSASSLAAGTYTNIVNQLISVTATSMPPSSAYYFTLRASNELTNIWAVSNGSFYKITPPVVNASTGATAVTITSATLSGKLSAGGLANAWICWGDNDAGIVSTSAWDHVQFMGTVNQDTVFSTLVTGLATNTTYFYRCVVTNSAGEDWSEPASSFNGLPSIGSSGSGYRMKISFPSYNKTETLTNFPALVVFSNNMAGTTFNFSTFLSANGHDLRFTDSTGTTPLNYEIDTWSTNASSYVWVQVPEFTSNCSIWASWGNPAGSNQLACTTNGSTWASNFVSVWHLAGTADSSTNRLMGVDSGSADASGVVGRGRAFNGSSSITFTSAVLNVTNQLTLEGWLCRTNGSSWAMAYGAGGSANWSYNWGVTDANKWGMELQAGSSTRMDGFAVTNGHWRHMALTFDAAGNERLYLDGVLATNAVTTGPIRSSSTFKIGRKYDSTLGWNGIIDELRVSHLARSSNWLWASYMTMASNAVFTTIGPVQSLAPIANLAPTELSDTSAVWNAVLSTPTTDYTVTVYWGPTDGGTNAVAWMNSANVGSWAYVAATNVSYAVSGLTPGGVYYYTFRATNSQTTAWAAPSWQVAPAGTNLTSKTTPTVSTWPTAANPITYGQAVSNAVLSGGSASVSGTFGYNAPTTIPNAGLYSAAVRFTPVDTTNYTTVAGVVAVTVNKATPTITSWPTASSIDYGQALSNAVLSGGSASVSGTFSYDAPSTMPSAGTYSAAVMFTPSDTINYLTVVGTINVTVNPNSAPVVNAGTDQTVLLTGGVWSPALLSPLAWYDASDAASITQSAGVVSQWLDKSGRTNTLSQATDANRPVTTNGLINGRTAITFDGVNDTLRTASNPFGTTISNAFMIAVLNVGTIAMSTAFSLSGYAAVEANRWQSHIPWSEGTVYFDCGGASGANRLNYASGWSANRVVLMGYYCSLSDTVQEIWEDGTKKVSDTSGHAVTTVGAWAIGSDGGTSYDNIKFGEAVIINGTITTNDRQSLEGYLANKWGLTNTLPVGHPYKAQAPATPAATATLDAMATDPDSDPLSILWSVVSGPGPVTFNDASIADTVANFTVEGVYTLRLSAWDGVFQSTDDVVITVTTNLSQFTIPPPTGLSASALATNQIKLAWTDNSTNETGFAIQRSLTSGSSFATIGSAAANATNYTDSTVSAATAYYYRVAATNATTNSVFSGEASATTPKLPATVTLGSLSQTFDGTVRAVTTTTSPTGLAVTVTYNGIAIAPTNAGNYAVTGTVVSTTYTGSTNGTLTVATKSVSGLTIGAVGALTYDGTAKMPTPSISDGATPLIKDTDYTLSYVANTNAGTASLTVTGIGNYTGTKGSTFTITPATLMVTPTAGQSKTFGAFDPTLAYNNSGAVGGQTAGFTGTLTRAIGEAVGTYAITQGTLALADNGAFKTSNYTLSFTAGVTFAITGKSVSTLTVSDVGPFIYDGTPKTPQPVVSDGAVILTNTVSYTLSYTNHTNAGTGTVVVTGAGSYSGTTNKTFTINQATPVMTNWPTASSIILGQALSNATLTGGSASVPGSFGYVSPTHVPPAGITNASVRFTPTDSLNYASVNGTVQVTVVDMYAVPFLEPFEARNLGVLNGQYGWLAEGTDVQTNKTFNNSARAAEVSGAGGYLKHSFNDARTKVWMDMRVQVVPYTSVPTPDTNSVGAVYVATNGMVMAFNGAAPVETGVTVQTNTWVRFTMFSDYTTKKYTLYVNDVRVGKYTFFNATIPSFAGIKVSGKDTVVDDVGITPNQPGMKYMPSLILLQ